MGDKSPSGDRQPERTPRCAPRFLWVWSDEYESPAKFAGAIESVTIDVQPIGEAIVNAVEEDNIEGLQREGEFE